MGRKIVREESPYNPGERSRLWFHRDIVDVLERNTGTNKVRMIVLNNWWECIEVNWDGEAFKSMKELKILIFENVKFSKDPKYLPKSLKVMKWRRYPSSCLPLNFSPKKLVVLDLGYSCLSSLKTIMKNLYNLGILNLSRCEYVKEIPDLSNLISLKELSLKECRNLIGIHDSIGYLPKLEILDVRGCVRLKTFPRAIKLPSLGELNLNRCSSLTYFPEILEKVKITHLSLFGTGIKKLPWSICNLSELMVLTIQVDFYSVIEIPNIIFLLPKIENILVMNDGKVMISCNSKEAQEEAIWSQQCPNRVVFNLPRCNISNDLLRTELSRYVNVKRLDLEGNDFTILPAWIKDCHFLETLLLNECKHLREVEGIPPNIRQLEAQNCASLSLESKSLLLSEELHGAPGRYNYEEHCYFWVPSRSIPKWFDHRSKGPSISFWFRHSFPPALCFCVLLKPPPDRSTFANVTVYINKKRASYYHLPSHNVSLMLDGDHLGVFYLKEDVVRTFETERILLEDRWNHAQFCVNSGARVLKEIGMYVIKQLCDMENITFTNPYHQDASDDEDDGVVDTNSNNDNNAEQVDTRMEEKVAALNKRRRLMENDNSASDDNDETTQVPFVKACERINNNQEQVGIGMDEKVAAVKKKRRLMGDDNFVLSSTAFICPINQDDNNVTPQVPFVKACEVINNNQEASLVDLNTTSLPMLPGTEQACDTFTNQGHSTEDEKVTLLASLLGNIHL